MYPNSPHTTMPWIFNGSIQTRLGGLRAAEGHEVIRARIIRLHGIPGVVKHGGRLSGSPMESYQLQWGVGAFTLNGRG